MSSVVPGGYCTDVIVGGRGRVREGESDWEQGKGIGSFDSSGNCGSGISSGVVSSGIISRGEDDEMQAGGGTGDGSGGVKGTERGAEEGMASQRDDMRVEHYLDNSEEQRESDKEAMARFDDRGKGGAPNGGLVRQGSADVKRSGSSKELTVQARVEADQLNTVNIRLRVADMEGAGTVMLGGWQAGRLLRTPAVRRLPCSATKTLFYVTDGS